MQKLKLWQEIDMVDFMCKLRQFTRKPAKVKQMAKHQEPPDKVVEII